MSGTSSYQAEGASRRTLALAVAALWLACQASGVLHLAFVPHVFCAEHGELIDADASADFASEATAARESAARVPVAIDAATSHQRHSHEHCLVTATGRRQLAPLLRRPAPIVVVGLSSAAPSAAEATHRPLLQLFRLAPKHSPPA